MRPHQWVIHVYSQLTVCKLCGIVMRKDGANSECKGKVKVEMRAKGKGE